MLFSSLISVERSEHLCSRWDNATFMMAAGTKFRAPMGGWATMENVLCQLGGPVSVREENGEQFGRSIGPPPLSMVRTEGGGGGGWVEYARPSVEGRFTPPP